MPHLPETKLCQNASFPLPIGETTPSPVTTTLRFLKLLFVPAMAKISLVLNKKIDQNRVILFNLFKEVNKNIHNFPEKRKNRQ
jgi:hypothetical protein